MTLPEHDSPAALYADAEKAAFAALVHDRMTEEMYRSPVTSFKVQAAGFSKAKP
jgi:hypothetical protein